MEINMEINMDIYGHIWTYSLVVWTTVLDCGFSDFSMVSPVVSFGPPALVPRRAAAPAAPP